MALRKSLDEVELGDLQALAERRIPESLTLEYKRELGLSSPSERREAAKDVSALANTAGGWLLYGMDEQVLADGSRVAGELIPLTDGELHKRLDDILLSSIHPRPRYRIKRLDSPEGYFLLVEVYPSLGNDLHMVTGYKDFRFYKRGDQGTTPMTEPEVREAYARVALRRAALEEALEAQVSAEFAVRADAVESILVVPWYGRRGLVDPRRLPQPSELLRQRINSQEVHDYAWNMKVFSNGFRGLSEGSDPAAAEYYLSITRTGIVHLSEKSALRHDMQGQTVFFTAGCITRLLTALSIASVVLDECAYWGPVRVFHRIHSMVPFTLSNVLQGMITRKTQVPPGSYVHVIDEVNLREVGRELMPIARELMDQLFQAASIAACPYFEEDGSLKGAYQKEIRVPSMVSR